MEKQISRKITLQSTKYVKTQYKFCAFFSFFELVLSGEVSLPDRKYNDTVENVLFETGFFHYRCWNIYCGPVYVWNYPFHSYLYIIWHGEPLYMLQFLSVILIVKPAFMERYLDLPYVYLNMPAYQIICI